MKEKTVPEKLSTMQITRIALMTAFISASSYLRIPLPFAGGVITGQTLAVNLVALVLTPSEAGMTMLCYWLLGVLGVPVYGGAAGPGKMFGLTGGYCAAFILAAFLIAGLRGKEYNFVRYVLVTVLIGIPVIDGIGFAWMKAVSGMTWKSAFATGFLPYLPLDAVKCIGAVLLAKPVGHAFRIMEDGRGKPPAEK
ncbi:MAG: biotin transporter BioY [Bacteroidales bacterium]|nr:biotin transporter BioY [Clostridium sp.]MCM1203327.1 biotin transporter BioY [Bacteroidales bacterium]